jgi:hypothetical protein
VELTRAEAWRRFGDGFVAGGRMELRPFSIPLHQGNQGFLRDVTRMDGVSAGYLFAPLHVQLFGGAPLEAGVVFGFEPEGIKLMASYTYRDGAVAQVPASLGIGNVVWSQRSFDSHEWDLAAVTFGDTLAISGVFQGRHSGEMRFADAANPRAAATPGSVDTALPRTSADYRALTQVSVLLAESGAGDGELWLAFAAGGASAPRFHAGTTEEILRRQGGGNQLFLGVSLEEIWSNVRAQGGFTLAQTSTPSYLWLNKRDDRGSLELSKSRVRGWIAVFLDF